MADPVSADVEVVGRLILDGPGEWIGSGAQLHELAVLIAARVRAEALREAADEVQREQRTVREHQALGFDPAGRLAILENLLRARARATSGELEPAACTCPRADESAWTHYCGATEPGSEREFDPECPQHGQCAGPVATPTEPAIPVDLCEHGRPTKHVYGSPDEDDFGLCPGPAEQPEGAGHG